MKFYQSGKEAVVWDPEANTALVEFKNGVFETKDKGIIAKLKKLGYPAVDGSDDGDGPKVSRLRDDDED